MCPQRCVTCASMARMSSSWCNIVWWAWLQLRQRLLDEHWAIRWPLPRQLRHQVLSSNKMLGIQTDCGQLTNIARMQIEWLRTMIYVHATNFEMACLDGMVLVMWGCLIEDIDSFEHCFQFGRFSKSNDSFNVLRVCWSHLSITM